MDLSQFTQAFFVEAIELLAQMEQLLLELDLEQPDNEQLNAIFRAAHSIKGGAATTTAGEGAGDGARAGDAATAAAALASLFSRASC